MAAKLPLLSKQKFLCNFLGFLHGWGLERSSSAWIQHPLFTGWAKDSTELSHQLHSDRETSAHPSPKSGTLHNGAGYHPLLELGLVEK